MRPLKQLVIHDKLYIVDSFIIIGYIRIFNVLNGIFH